MARWRGIVLVLASLLPLPALAYRPFDSTDGDVAELGHIEIEFGPVGYLGVGAQQFLTLPELVLNYGFAPGWEVVLQGAEELQIGAVRSEPLVLRLHLDETELTVKHVLRPGVLQGATGVSVATEFGLLLPTWNDVPGMGLWAAGIVSWRPSELLTLHFNFAFQLTRALQPGTQDGIIFDGPEKWVVRPVAELLGEYDQGGYWQGSCLVGAIWTVSDAVALDAAFRAGDSEEGRILEVRAGVTWSFPVGVSPWVM